MFVWKVENFTAFKEIMETRKIFSRYFSVGGCELRLGVYESFDTLCIYLESNGFGSQDAEHNFWVKYRIAVENHRIPSRSEWRESSICTRTWNNSVLQFLKVSDLLEHDAGFVSKDAVTFSCTVLDCCPWFDFAEVDQVGHAATTDAATTMPHLVRREGGGAQGGGSGGSGGSSESAGAPPPPPPALADVSQLVSACSALGGGVGVTGGDGRAAGRAGEGGGTWVTAPSVSISGQAMPAAKPKLSMESEQVAFRALLKRAGVQLPTADTTAPTPILVGPFQFQVRSHSTLLYYATPNHAFRPVYGTRAQRALSPQDPSPPTRPYAANAKG